MDKTTKKLRAVELILVLAAFAMGAASLTKSILLQQTITTLRTDTITDVAGTGAPTLLGLITAGMITDDGVIALRLKNTNAGLRMRFTGENDNTVLSVQANFVEISTALTFFEGSVLDTFNDRRGRIIARNSPIAGLLFTDGNLGIQLSIENDRVIIGENAVVGMGIPEVVGLGVAATTFAVTESFVEIDPDAGGNPLVATITGTNVAEGIEITVTVGTLSGGMTLIDNASPGADQLAMNGNAVMTADSVIKFIRAGGGYWRETSRSLN